MASPMSYLNFDLQLRRNGDGYRAQVVAAPGGEDGLDFKMPVDAKDLEIFLLKIGRPRGGKSRGGATPEAMATREFGEKLFGALFSGGVATCWASSYAQAHEKGLGLRLRLRIQDAPELNDIPWEYLYVRSERRFLPLSLDTPLVRYLELPGGVKPLEVTAPLRVLVMISSPSNLEQLDVEAEWKKLQKALEPLERSGAVIVDRLPVARLQTLQDQLRRHEYHVLHFVGHGTFDRDSDAGALVLCDGDGLAKVVPAERLATITRNHRSLRLVVLNSCLGARTSMKDPLSGMAQTLVQQGVPAVVAMQFEISDDAAIAFAEEFYQAVADGYPVDAALTEARVAIYALDNEVEWGTPVLYLRSADGKLFSITRDPTAVVPPPKPIAAPVFEAAPRPPEPKPATPRTIVAETPQPASPPKDVPIAAAPSPVPSRIGITVGISIIAVVVTISFFTLIRWTDSLIPVFLGLGTASPLIPLWFGWKGPLYGLAALSLLAAGAFTFIAIVNDALPHEIPPIIFMCLAWLANAALSFSAARRIGRMPR